MKFEIKRTKNYSIFSPEKGNRMVELDRAERKQLRKSMIEYGFIPAFPIVCFRHNGKLKVKDGQGRLAVAQELKTEVWYVVVDQDFDLAKLNQCVAKWNWMDYATKFTSEGNDDYQRVIDFAAANGLTMAISATILAGADADGASNFRKEFKAGKYKVKNEVHAEEVARLYNRLGDISSKIKNKKLLSALHKIIFVPGFDAERLISGAKRSPERLVNYGTTEGYLEMLEEVYNFGRKIKEPIKIAAENAARIRNPANRGKIVADNHVPNEHSNQVVIHA